MAYVLILLLFLLVMTLWRTQKKVNANTRRQQKRSQRAIKAEIRERIAAQEVLLQEQTKLRILQEKEKSERIKAESKLQKEQERQRKQLEAQEKRLRQLEYKNSEADLELEYVIPRMRQLDRDIANIKTSLEFCNISGGDPAKFNKALDKANKEMLSLQKRQLKAQHSIDEYAVYSA